jgi:HlyD family secretion protein
VQDNARTIQDNLKAAQDSLKAAQTRLDQLLWYFQLDTVLTAARADVSRAQAEVTRWQAELAGQPAQISRAQASIDSAKAQLEKLLEPPDQLAVDAARAQLTSAQQSVAEIKRQIGEAFLYSSIDGIVAAEPGVKEGDMAVSGRTVLQIIDPSRFKLEVDIDETDIPQVVVGQSAVVEMDALPDVKVPGKVSYISSLPTESGGIILYRVTVDLPPGEVLSLPSVVRSGLALPDKVNLRSGMSASADIIITERKNVVKLPSRVITKDSQGTSVVTVETNGQVQTRQVTLGVSDGLDTEILQGLAVGENVVIPKQGSESSSSLFGGG